MHWRRKWQPTPVLPGESQVRRSLVCCHLWGRDWTELNWTIAIWIRSLKKYPFRSLAHFWCVCVCVCVCVFCFFVVFFFELHAPFACFADELLVDIFSCQLFSTLRVVIFFRYGFPCCVSASKVNEVLCWVFLISIFHYSKRWIQREFAVIYAKACFSYAFL